ncbi:ankyrin [Daldinia caldariorum]|uniref:ankyrin n=1 Tax=Daldinia caldariorum TaxID=326644 RepID=UPI00200837A6|nr:ankyrin [Daldinia caldariorum]KAI1466173.1 ankyrin [Daldinia caldariorum]
MEVVGSVASIAQLIEITAKVFHYCVTIIGASKMIDELGRTSSVMVQLLYEVKRQVDADASAGRGRPLGPDDFVRELQACMIDLSRQFEKTSSKGLAQKIRFAHMEKDIQRAIEKASRMNGFLNSWLTLDIKETTKSIDRGVKALNSHAEEEMINGKIDDIVKHYAPISFSEKHGNVVQQRQDGTGQWFLESEEFQDWMQSVGGTMWCSGAPGAGKTVMASIAIEYIREKVREAGDGRLAFLYCDYRQRQDQKSWMMLGNLWAQFFRQRDPSATEVEQLFGEIAARFDFKPTRTQTLNMIRDELTNGSPGKTYIVVDALDECADENERNGFIDSLRSLQPLINVLVTSRTTHFDSVGFTNVQAFRFIPTNEDMSTYINARIRGSKKMSGYVQRKPELEEDIRKSVIERANGMFLLCRMHLDSLSRAITLKDLKREMGRIPKGENVIKDTYDQAMERIRDQGVNIEKFALQVIRWVCFARRPLRLAELLCALSISPDDTELDEDAIGEESDVTNYCAGLVVVEGESKTVRFVHYTTQEYFNSLKDTPTFAHSHGEIALTCISFLGFDDLTLSTNGPLSQIWFPQEDAPFFAYAALHFGHHYAQESNIPNVEEPTCLEDIMELLLNFLQRPEHVKRTATSILKNIGGSVSAIFADPCLRDDMPATGTTIDLAAFFNVIKGAFDNRPFGVKIEWLLKITSTTADLGKKRFGNSLHWACLNNSVESMKILLETPELELDINLTVGHCFGWLPAIVSVAYTSLGTLQALLDHGIDIYKKSAQELCTTLLEEAIWWAHAVKGPDKTILIEAIMQRDANGKLLLLRDAYSSTALMEAVRTADFNIFECVMKHHNRIESIDRRNEAILTCDFHRRTVLHWAVADSSLAFKISGGEKTSGILRILMTLLDSPYANILLKWQDQKGDTPFEAAIRRNNIQAVDTILKKHDEHNFPDFYPSQLVSGLNLAARVASSPVIDLLLSRMSDDLLQNPGTDSALHYAAGGSRPENTEFLLQKLKHLYLYGSLGANENRPIHYAAASGNIDAVMVLSKQKGFNIDCQNDQGHTALHLAANQNLIDICSNLVKAGANINVIDSNGLAPLGIAIKKRFPEIVRIMARRPITDPISIDDDDIAWIRQQPWGNALIHDPAGPSDSAADPAIWPREESDIITAALCLQRKFRVSKHIHVASYIISRILDLAQYWVKSTSIRVSIEKGGEVRRWADPLTPYITSKAINSLSSRPVRRIVFEITSHDQGYCSDPSRGESWTWFTADVHRRGNTFSQNLASPQDQGGTTNREIYLVHNRGANIQWHMHTLSWNLNDHTETDAERESWIKALGPGDRILVLPHARYPGWENWVRRVRIDVYTTCLRSSAKSWVQ